MAKHKGPRKPSTPKKPPLTHFLCIPLVTAASRPHLEASVTKFKNSDAANGSQAIHPKAIRPVGALHLTLGVSSLDKDKLAEAVDFLKGVDLDALLNNVVASKVASSEEGMKEDIAVAAAQFEGLSSIERPISPPATGRSMGPQTPPLTIDLKGLESMHSPQKTSILYISPTNASGRLYPFCVALQKLFKDKGFLLEDNRQLKLHATIVNTIYAKGRKLPSKSVAALSTSGTTTGSTHDTAAAEQVAEPRDDRTQGHGPNANAPLKIDATAILEKYKDFVWADNVVLDRVAICEMGAKKVVNDAGIVIGEEYTEIAGVPLPHS